MRDSRFIIGLLIAAVFVGGCIMEPLEPEAGEEDIGTVAAEVNTALPSAPQDDETTGQSPNTSLRKDSVRASRSGVDAVDTSDKPQPDPWTGLELKPEDSVTP